MRAAKGSRKKGRGGAPVHVAEHAARIDAFSEARNAIMARIIELEGGLEHAVEGASSDSRIEGLREAEILLMRLQGEVIGVFDPKDRKAAMKGYERSARLLAHAEAEGRKKAPARRRVTRRR